MDDGYRAGTLFAPLATDRLPRVGLGTVPVAARGAHPLVPADRARHKYAAKVVPPSGEQYVLVWGDQRAVIAEVGATLREFEEGGAPVCWGFGEGAMCSGGRGQVLVPWPNRLRDGTYKFDGVSARAALDEPARANATHGLVRWVPWRLVDKSPSAARLTYGLHPQPAYPFGVSLEIDYRLGDSGLAVTLTATAEGDRRIPFGAGFHPYVHARAGGADGARIALPAARRLLLDARALPVGAEDVLGTPYEVVASPAPVAEHQALGSLRIDDCFTDLAIRADGCWRAELLPEGYERPVALWADPVFKYVMCFTGDTLAPADRRVGVALEPMTCPPDALRTGDDLIVLEPGETFTGSWGIIPAGTPR